MSEVQAITRVIEQYIEGGVVGKTSVMSPAFHDNATIYSVTDGKVEGGPIQILFDGVEGNPAPNLTGVISNVEVNNDTTATATLVLSDWAGAEFTDQFTLLNGEGGWKILSKVFHDRT